MLAAFERSLGLPAGGLPPPLFFRCQLWGAALPLNSPGVECILDTASRVGVCGDWLLGGSMQAAAVSGIALADRIASMRGRGAAEAAELAIGLDAPFKPLGAGATAIGEFPGAPPPPPGAAAAAAASGPRLATAGGGPRRR